MGSVFAKCTLEEGAIFRACGAVSDTRVVVHVYFTRNRMPRIFSA